MSKIIAFVSYEGPWFPAGGIAAVMGQLPLATKVAARLPTVVVTPYHESDSPKNKIHSFSLQEIHDSTLTFRGIPIQIRVFHADAGCSTYFIKAEAQGIQDPTAPRSSFFTGKRHPYDVPSNVLLRDSLFFGVATVQALSGIAAHLEVNAQHAEWNLIAQDWEAATTLLAFSSQTESRGRIHLTLHNSYDAFAADVDLNHSGINPACCPGDTILHRALSIIEKPAFTVSDQFALDFTQDLLQRKVMAPQLQTLLNRDPVIGVDNGPFKQLAVSQEHLRDATIGNFANLKEWKANNREKAMIALDAHVSTDKEPVWGDKSKFRRDDSPWFVMAGRDDPRQKGYDVAVAAIENYLKEHHGTPNCAQFCFFPIPGDEDLSGLEFLKALALQYPEDVIVFPFIWIAGFTAALQGAAYGLMPSLYEPFGMANEFYLAGGCVGIGRATGGNLEQIVPLRATSACSRAVQIRADRYHAFSAHPTGILFRESDEIPSASRDWAEINEANYKIGGSPSRVEQRLAYAVFQEMATEMRISIEDGIHIYRQLPELYYRMLAEGIAHIQHAFSWQRAGQEYARKVR